MIDFVSLPPPPILVNHITGCHENHAFHLAQAGLFVRSTLFYIKGVPMNYLEPKRNWPGSARPR